MCSYFQKKSKRLSIKVNWMSGKKISRSLWIRNVFPAFLFNNLVTPQSYPGSLCRGPVPQMGNHCCKWTIHNADPLSFLFHKGLNINNSSLSIIQLFQLFHCYPPDGVLTGPHAFQHFSVYCNSTVLPFLNRKNTHINPLCERHISISAAWLSKAKTACCLLWIQENAMCRLTGTPPLQVTLVLSGLMQRISTEAPFRKIPFPVLTNPHGQFI